MPPRRRPIRIPITIALAGDEYTGRIHLGSQRQPVDVILDTGSSSLAVLHTAYDPRRDRHARTTNYAQKVPYGDGTSWSGSLVRTNVAVSASGRSVDLRSVSLAVVYHQQGGVFGKARGILGLGFQPLNDAVDVGARTIPPRYTYNDYTSGQKIYLDPYFTRLEESGLEANKFAFSTHRSVVCMTGDPQRDPINQGVLVLGGGEEATDLYRGGFQSARVLSDDYWNVNLTQVIVEGRGAIEVRPPSGGSRAKSSAIVDSGTNGIDLAPDLFEAVLRKLTPRQAAQMRKRIQLRESIRYPEWPRLGFVLEGMPRDVSLEIAPEDYWQSDGWNRGEVYRTLWRGSEEQSTLGLPLMNPYFTVFDGSANRGLGVVKFARARSA